MTLRIGEIDYANCTPIFSALRRNYDCSAYRFIKGVPSHLNRMLSNGEIDLCPSSSIEYGRSAGSYLLLPDLSISSVGPVKSVVLFSTTPLEELDSATIGLTSDSATSVALLRIILKKYYNFSNRFVVMHASNPADALGTCRAVLLIGDNALKSRDSSAGLYQYDMGELWYSLTGRPFIFALWMIRAESVEAVPEECSLINARLRGAKREALATLDQLAVECSEMNWMGRDALISYWRTISYDLTPQHFEGVKLFFRYAAEMGILEEEPVLRFLS
jgi:chorismate dehydratase